MPAIDFPNSPSVGQTYTVGTRTWTWSTNFISTSRTNLITNPNLEVDTTSWTGSNASISRSTSQFYYGTASLQIVGSGAQTYCSAYIRGSVTPSTAYTASFYVVASVGTPNVRATINWYTSGNVYLSQTTGTVAASTTSWNRYSVTGTAPSTAAYADVVVECTSGVSAGTTIFADSVLLETGSTLLPYFDGSYSDDTANYTCVSKQWNSTANASTSTATWTNQSQRTNLITNPSFENNTTGWTTTGGATAVQSTAYQYIGADSLLVTSTATSYNGATLVNRIPITPSMPYYLSAYCRNVSGSTRMIYIGIQWFTAAGAYISEVNSGGQGTLTTAAGWVRRSAFGVAPVNAATAQIFMLSGTTGLTAGWESAFDGVLFEAGTTLRPYFDGSYIDAYSGYSLISQSWSGTSHASTSTATFGADGQFGYLWLLNASTISAGVVGTNELAAGSVTTAKLGTNAVTASTLASSPTNNYVLTADSTTGTGSKWAVIPPSGGLSTTTEGAIMTMAIGA